MPTVLEETYEFGEDGTIHFACPAALATDTVLRIVDLMQRHYGAGVVDRLTRKLRVRLYLREIELGDRTLSFEPLMDVIARMGPYGQTTEGLWELAERMEATLSFASEVMMRILDRAAERFKAEIQDQADQSLKSEEDEWVEKAHRIKDNQEYWLNK